jgi:hypothetical protein
LVVVLEDMAKFFKINGERFRFCFGSNALNCVVVIGGFWFTVGFVSTGELGQFVDGVGVCGVGFELLCILFLETAVLLLDLIGGRLLPLFIP